MNTTVKLALVAALAAAPVLASAQTTYYDRHHIAARAENQQDRIAQGVKSGQLTPRETSRLEHQEASIHREDERMRAHDNGHLTARDRHVLAHRQNVESRRIYRDKHNDRRF